MFRRVFLVILDGLGVGALPDAEAYGDAEASTLAHVVEAASPRLPHLSSLGLFHAAGLPAPGPARALHGRMATLSRAKDTQAGHHEMAGLVTREPPPAFPRGFPQSLIEELSRRAGRPVLGNVAASGTEIIARLGAEQVRAGGIIVYTSADSVLQIAAHEDVVGREELYRICREARELCAGPLAVTRVIARPFRGADGAFARTDGRRDFGLPPAGPTLLDLLSGQGLAVEAVGKISDIFSGRGVTRSLETAGNAEGLQALRELMESDFTGLAFANLNDFDTLYGHRRDAAGFARALEEVDAALPGLLERLGSDLLLLTADHGCDPAHPGTDHTREYVPLLAWHRAVRPGTAGTRESLADAGRTVARNFGLDLPAGRDFLQRLQPSPEANDERH